METRKRIRDLLEEKKKTTGKTQAEIAKEIGTTSQTITAYTSPGDNLPNMGVQQLLSLCNYFNCTPGYLLCTSDDPMKENTVKSIAQYTGLSNKAVENLHQYTKANDSSSKSEQYKGEAVRFKYSTGKAVLSILLEQEEFYSAISAFAQSIAHEENDDEFFFRYASRPKYTLANLAVRGEDQTPRLDGYDPSKPTEEQIINAAYELGYMCVTEKFYAKCCLHEGLDRINRCVKKIQKAIQDKIQQEIEEWINEPDPNIKEGGASDAQHQENDK